jgi:hypothetical protein
MLLSGERTTANRNRAEKTLLDFVAAIVSAERYF